MIANPIIREAVSRAQKLLAERRAFIGETVCHPNEPVTMELLEVNGDIATIGYQDRKLCVPVLELFNPNDAGSIASEIELELTKKQLEQFDIYIVEI